MDPSPFVIILVADGVRPDTLSAAMHDGELPALARFRKEGSYHVITTAFPSVTGPAYAPFLTGRFPGQAGLPGLRWYDRSRTTCGWPAHARSYVGMEMNRVDSDLDPGASTLFELAGSSLGALSVIRRGLATHNRLERGLTFAARAGITHFRGNVRGWLAIDRDIGNTLVRRVRAERPAVTFAAFTGVDKTSHAAGHDAPIVREALHIVDDVAAQIQRDAERDGVWERTHLWIVSDHGHSPVLHHDDLADVIRALGVRVVAHPRVFTRHPDVAVMVSGNAMAHVYLALDQRERPFWNALRTRRIGASLDSNALVQQLCARPSVDLVLLPTSPTSCEIVKATQSATLSWTSPWSTARFTYTPVRGDPLGIGMLQNVTSDDAYTATLDSDYPDAVVQIAAICSAPRSGDIILSAARLWDYRGKYEPIPHVSSHGALHREHMLVPFLSNHPIKHTPQRTVDIMPSVASLLGRPIEKIDGRSFVAKPNM